MGHQAVIVEHVDPKQAGSIESTHEAQDSAVAGPSEPTSATTFNSLGDLKEKAPHVYNKMLECMAMEICREMDKHQNKMKKIQREASRHS